MVVSNWTILSLLTIVSVAPATGLSWSTSKSNSVKATQGKENDRWVEQISWHPRAYIYHNFMTHDECDQIVQTARPMMKRSTVVGNDGGGVLNQIRTSYGTFIRRKKIPLVTEIEERLERWTHLPLVHQEDMQILRYAEGQKYGAHFDSFDQSSPRLCTVLMYLKDDGLEGGETAFPSATQWIGNSKERGPFSACAEGHVAAKVRKGDALLFYNLNSEGIQDETSLHTGCPVLAGIKWTATKWIHTKPFNPEWLNKTNADPEILPEDCQDVEANCPGWAKSGECEKNPGYMMGTTGSGIGSCRLSCKACEVCADRDRECKNRNRVKDGFLPLDDVD